MGKTNWAWLAGIIDGEGTISVILERRYSLIGYVSVSNTDNKITEKCKEITKVGYIYYHKSKKPNRKDWSCWVTSGEPACRVIEKVLPFLVSKGNHAHTLLEIRDIKKFIGYHKKGSKVITNEAIKERQDLRNKFRKLNS